MKGVKMLFSKNNSNSGGECLCHSCVYGLKKETKNEYYCKRTFEEVYNVGVCNKYEDFKR